MSEVKFNIDIQKNIKTIINECPGLVKFIDNPDEELVVLAINAGLDLENKDSPFNKTNLCNSDSSKIQIALFDRDAFFYSGIKKPTEDLIEHVINKNPSSLLVGSDNRYKTEKKFIDLIVETQPKFAANYLYKTITAKQFIDLVRKNKIFYHEKMVPDKNESKFGKEYREQNDLKYSGIRAKQMGWNLVKINRKFSNEEFNDIHGIKLTIRANPWLILCLKEPSKEFQILAARKLQKMYGLDNILTDKDAISVYNGYKACEDIIA